jgi:hypothetical protein
VDLLSNRGSTIVEDVLSLTVCILEVPARIIAPSAKFQRATEPSKLCYVGKASTVSDILPPRYMSHLISELHAKLQFCFSIRLDAEIRPATPSSPPHIFTIGRRRQRRSCNCRRQITQRHKRALPPPPLPPNHLRAFIISQTKCTGYSESNSEKVD